MIHFYVGKPRNGKSLRVMMKIIEVLTKTPQHVVTNMVLRLDVLQEYLDSKGFSVHVLDRVTILDDEQTRLFFLYRKSAYVLPMPKNNDDNVDYTPLFTDPVWRIGRKLFTPEGAPTNFEGTCYVIDECQNLWPSRTNAMTSWKDGGRHLAFYLSQHGKLGDTVFMITQNVKNVDRMVYSLAQDFTYCRNHRMEKHGRFRGDNKFSAKTYPGPVQDGSEATMNVEEFKLDLEIAACYDTSAGVGMPGGGTADAGYRAKGLPFKLVWVGLGLILCFVYWVFNYGLPNMASGFFSGKIVRQKVVSGGASAGTERKGAQVITASVADEHRTGAVKEDRVDVPELSGVWVDFRNGAPVVHAFFDGGAQIPARWITAYNLDDWPSGWVEAKGVRYYLRQGKVRTLEAATSHEVLASR